MSFMRKHKLTVDSSPVNWFNAFLPISNRDAGVSSYSIQHSLIWTNARANMESAGIRGVGGKYFQSLLYLSSCNTLDFIYCKLCLLPPRSTWNSTHKKKNLSTETILFTILLVESLPLARGDIAISSHSSLPTIPLTQFQVVTKLQIGNSIPVSSC